ncbi:MAG: diguanylate cyclase [Terriglobales bacterium]
MDSNKIPARAIVEVLREPNEELFHQRHRALTGLLRLALLSGMELTLPTTLHLLLDISQSVVASDRQLVIFGSSRDPASHRQLGRHFDPPLPPEREANLLDHWVGRAGKPVLAGPGLSGEMDSYLERVQARAAVATPLFLEHDWVGSIQLFRTSGKGFNPADGRLLWILSLLAENQMSRIHAFQQLTRMAFTDFLTGLRARGYFEQALEQEVHRALRLSSSCGLLLADLDGFKKVNDRYGHRAGDEVLRQFARILSRDMRDVDTVARFGGDEFALILPDTHEDGVRLVARRIQERVRAHRFRLPDSQPELQLSASLGIALCPGDERRPDQLLRAADLALYQAKQSGKDQPYLVRELRAS